VLLSFLAFRLYIDYLHTVRLSSVDLPMRAMLEHISVGIDESDTSGASAQVRLLSQRWQEFLDGGRTPELFMAEVVAAGLPPAPAGQLVSTCNLAPPHVSIQVPLQGLATPGDGDLDCSLEDTSDWVRMSAGDRDLLVSTDGPLGSGRYWTVTIGLAIPGADTPDRGLCLSTSTIGWRTLQQFGSGPLRWLDDIDEDGHPEVVIWDSFQLSDEPIPPSFGLVAWAYDLSNEDSLSIDWDSSRNIARQLARAYGTRLDTSDRQLLRSRSLASTTLRRFAENRCATSGESPGSVGGSFQANDDTLLGSRAFEAR
jgi:hypothetical protein